MAESLDVHENEMTVNNKAPYLRGVDSAGNSVRVDNKMFTINKQAVTVDCNEMKIDGRYSAYHWKNSPYNNIAVLEVIQYSNDWIIQKIYAIGANSEVFIRSWYSGKSWSEWRQI